MRIVLFLALFLISLSECAFTWDNYSRGIAPQYTNFSNPNLGVFDMDTLNYLENSLYGKMYSNNTTANRLKRLENTIFGINTYGTNSERLKRLSDAYVKYKRENIYSNSENRAKSNLKRLSKILFNGVPTGYTPQIMQNYNSPYNTTSNRINPSGYHFEKVYCDRFGNCTPYTEDITTNMGVKIIRD